jgi:hypothetical protein
MRPGQGLRALVPLAGAGAIAIASWAVPGQAAASHPLPVKTVSGKNYNTPDPGVLLYHGRFYGFSTGGGLREWTALTAGGPWTPPVNELVRSTLPGWVDTSKGIRGPHMIRTTSGTFVGYFSAALKGTTGNPPGNDAKPASGARCIGTATSSSPTGPFRAAPRPLVRFAQYGAADTMTGDPGNRVRGEGVLSGAASLVTINGQVHRRSILRSLEPGLVGRTPRQNESRKCAVRRSGADS